MSPPWRCVSPLLRVLLQIPYQVDIVRGCVDNDSIGALVCRRAEQVDAVAVVMAKHSRGTIK
jgi:structural maintenance of chromosome 2